MKHFIAKALVVVSMALVLAGCKDEKLTVDLTKDAKYGVQAEEVQTMAYGPVVANPGMAVKPKVVRTIFGEGISGLVIVSAQPNPQVITLVCENRTNAWGVNHSVKNMDGSAGVTSENEDTGAEMSIYNFPKGTKDIREQYEYITPIMATADGQTRLGDALKQLNKLERDSVVAFAFEYPDANQEYSEVKGWSVLFKAGDLADALKKVDTSDCNNVSADNYATDIGYTPIETVIAEAKRARS